MYPLLARLWTAIHTEYYWFFRLTLLRLKPEAVKKLIDDYDAFCIAMKKNALSMAWYMRGGASYEDILNMSSAERQELAALIEYNLDMTKKSQLPFFWYP